MPDDEAATGIHSQTALANLSASSRRLCSIAQSILFHFFHSLTGWIDTRRRLAAFVHTLFHRPDLALSVKALVLWSPNADIGPHDPKGQYVDREIKDDDHTFARAAEQLGFRHAGEQQQYWSLPRLQELAMALASGAGYVLLQRGLGELRPGSWKSRHGPWMRPMESLRHAVLVGWRKGWPRYDYSFHVKEAGGLLRCARNLERLVVAEGGGDRVAYFIHGYQDEVEALPWDVELPRLRRLSINGEGVGVKEVEGYYSA
jgi:hypothetical protein